VKQSECFLLLFKIMSFMFKEVWFQATITRR